MYGYDPYIRDYDPRYDEESQLYRARDRALEAQEATAA